MANSEVEEFSYNMSHPRRGKAIIFSHKTFDDQSLETRFGAEKDEESLCHTLTMLKFERKVYRDKTVKQIRMILRELSDEDHSDADCLLVAVLTHGKEGGRLYDADGVDYSQDVLWDPFSKENDTLACKPKVFIINACRGDKVDSGKLVRSSVHSDAAAFVPGASHRIPNFADFLIFRSTPPGYVSWRNEETGSWFIQALCKVLDNTLGQEDFSKDLLTLFTRVAYEVSREETDGNKKQIPEVCSRLTKDIYFH